MLFLIHLPSVQKQISLGLLIPDCYEDYSTSMQSLAILNELMKYIFLLLKQWQLIGLRQLPSSVTELDNRPQPRTTRLIIGASNPSKMWSLGILQTADFYSRSLWTWPPWVIYALAFDHKIANAAHSGVSEVLCSMKFQKLTTGRLLLSVCLKCQIYLDFVLIGLVLYTSHKVL